MIPGTFDLTLYKGSTFGPIIIYAREVDETTPIDLTGWLAHAKVRDEPSGYELIDLSPYISDGALGQITIPEISDEDTASIPPGCYVWDLLLERPNGAIIGPFLAGSFTITSAVARA